MCVIKIVLLILILICYSARPLRGHHALVWMVGFRMAGFMLSESGIRVFVLGNMELGWGGWGKVQVNYEGGWGYGRAGWGVEGDRGGGVCFLLEVPEGCSCQVNVLQCTLEWVETVMGKYIGWKSVPLGYCSGKEAVFVVVV